MNLIGTFDPSDGGVLALFEHAIWVFFHPPIWLVAIKWVFVITGVVLIARWLKKSKRYMWLTIFLIACAAGLVGTVKLIHDLVQLSMEGRGNEVFGLAGIVDHLTTIIALSVIIWILFLRKKNR